MVQLARYDAAMVDLETLSLRTDAVVFQVGLVFFNWADDNVFEYSWEPNVLEQILLGNHIDPDTVKWWQEQGEPTAMDGGPHRIAGVLRDFSAAIEAHQPLEIWANSPSFDLEKMRHQYRLCNKTVPWSHKQERDYRTIRARFTLVGSWPEENGEPAHDTVADCTYQIKHLRAAINRGCQPFCIRPK